MQNVKNLNGLVIAVSFALLIIRLIFVILGPLDLAPDEAQYWDWIRYPSWSYVTKPPLTTWLIYLSTSIFGNTFLGVRFFALVGQTLVPILAYAIVKQHSGEEKSALWAFWLMLAMPLIAAGGIIMSPDVPSLTLWLLALLFVMKIDWTNLDHKFWPNWLLWIGIGGAIGLAGLAKPTAAMFYPLLGLFMLVNHRKWLFKPQVYVAGIFSFTMQAPVFYWNATHNWAMFAHVTDQTNSDSRWAGFSSLLDFIGGQAGAVGPITFLVLLWVFACGKKGALWYFSFPVFVGFTLVSLTGKVQVNWPILGMTTAVLLLATYLPNAKKAVKYALILGIILNLTVVILAHDTFILRAAGVSLKVKNDPTKPLLGWRGIGEQLGDILAQYPNTPILTSRYQTTAGLAFHTPQKPLVRYVNAENRRHNHYDYIEWQPHTGPMLYVNEGNYVPKGIADMFNSCTSLSKLTATRRQTTLRTAGVFWCE